VTRREAGARAGFIDAKRRGRLDLDVLLIVLLVIGFNLSNLTRNVVPINDTYYNFANFHVFYSEFFFHRDLAHWYPYGTYGLQSDYEQIIALSPASYFVGLLGALLGVRDALLLFKLGALLEQLAFVFGVYLLSQRLFATRATTRILCIAAAGTSVWYAQQWWDFRIYYLLPLVLFFAVCFLQTKRPHYVWLAGLTGVVWALGNLTYVFPLLALVLLVFVLVAAWPDYRGAAAALATPSRANLLAVAGFAVASSGLAYFVLHALDSTSMHVIFRDPVTGKVDLETFRSYGGTANLVIVANSLLFGWPLQLPWGSGADNSVYIGLVPLVGFALALARERSRPFLGLVAAAIVLVWLSFGGLFTTLAYYLPGFSSYRHVGLVFGLVKVLILLASGYGLERLWALGAPRLSNRVFILVAAALQLELLAALLGVLEPPTAVGWLAAWGNHVLLRLCVYAALLGLGRLLSWPLARALAIGLVFDLLLYQLAVYQIRMPLLKARDLRLLEAVQVHEPHYQPERRELPIDPAGRGTTTAADARNQLAFDLTTRPGASREVYWYVYPFSNFDPCSSQFRTDILSAGVDSLLSLRRDDFPIDAIVGCRAPKLRLVADARVVGTPEEARDALLAGVQAGGERSVVVQVPSGAAPAPGGGPEGGPAGRVRVTRFTLNELVADVQVEAPQGAWLVYADAYHPGWRASVNGQETPVYPADLAFKALRVPPGSNVVRFWFHHGLNHFLSYAIAGLGVASAVVLLAFVIAALLGRIAGERG
jgi:hypothetical protein